MTVFERIRSQQEEYHLNLYESNNLKKHKSYSLYSQLARTFISH